MEKRLRVTGIREESSRPTSGKLSSSCSSQGNKVRKAETMAIAESKENGMLKITDFMK